MFTFTPTDEQQMLIDTIRRFNEGVRKVAHDSDETGEAPAHIIAKGWDLGLLPGLIPEAYGGYAEEPGAVTGVLALEELAWGDIPLALTTLTPAAFALAVLISGTEDQKQHYLPEFCDAHRPVMTAALVEPNPLFDPWRPTTTASQENGIVRLTGQKTCVPLADSAERILVYAADSETGAVGGYIVERDTPGLSIGERVKLMGLNALPLYSLNLTDVIVDSDKQLGGTNGTDFKSILHRSRIAIASLAAGVARASLEYARDYARERVQFGVPIGTKQAVAFRLADVAIEIDAARILAWEAAWQADRNCDLTQSSTWAYQLALKTAAFSADSGVQVLGGHGYIREHPVERWLRNAAGLRNLEGLVLV